MLPFAVINEPVNPPSRPVSWTSKHHFDIKGTEIQQPKPKISEGSQTQPLSDIRGTEKNMFSTEQLSNPHVIDGSRQPIKGFKVGSPHQQRRTSYQRHENSISSPSKQPMGS